jgi:hypothetical protein
MRANYVMKRSKIKQRIAHTDVREILKECRAEIMQRLRNSGHMIMNGALSSVAYPYFAHIDESKRLDAILPALRGTNANDRVQKVAIGAALYGGPAVCALGALAHGKLIFANSIAEGILQLGTGKPHRHCLLKRMAPGG